MRIRISVLTTVMLLALLTALAAAAGPAFRNYSADMVMTSPEATVMKSKVYATGQKQRIETKAEGQDTIMITRLDKKLAWMCMKNEKMCMEMPLNRDRQDIISEMNDPDAQVDKKFLGNENIDGHPAKKYHMTVTRHGKKESTGFIWEATDLNNFPIKYQTEDKSSTITWKNISFNPVSDSLFEIPSGYQKMNMQGMPGMGGMGKKRK